MGDEDTDKLEDKLEQVTKEMRDRSHQLAGIIQQQSVELAGLKTLSQTVRDLGTALAGDPTSGVDTGLKGAVQRLYQEVRDTEGQRQKDSRRNEEQWKEVIEQNRQQNEKIEKLTNYAERRGGALGLVREIGSTITVVAAAGGLVLGIIKIAMMK